MSIFLECLSKNSFLQERNKQSQQKIDDLKREINSKISDENITVFVTGSLGRQEVGANSDLDFFIISLEKLSKLKEIQIFSKMIEINTCLKFPELSNDGEYLKVHYIDEMLSIAGSPKDDEQNMFTERMLLFLESKCIFSDKNYDDIIEKIISMYLRDSEGRVNFKPLFLVNDILRFWRTLCLNYEQTRHTEGRPWKKKNINLKYSRMLTVFATIAYLVSMNDVSIITIKEMLQKTPLERLATSLDTVDDGSLKEEFEHFLSFYARFLEAKEKNTLEDSELDSNAIAFSDFFYKVLTHDKIKQEYKKYLVI